MIKRTKHFVSRMNQRGMSNIMVDAVLEYGVYKQDRVILSQKRLKKLVRRHGEDHRVLMQLLDKGGVTVVLDEGTLITTYACNFHNRRRLVA